MVLIKICEPFNAYRIFLIIITFVLMLVTIILMGETLGITPFDFTQPVQLASLFLLISMVLLTYFVVSMVMKVLITIKVMTE